MAISEDAALEILKRILPRTYKSASRWKVKLGIGDDAALLSRGPVPQRTLSQAGELLVWTLDACEEGAHFLGQWMTPEDVAHKAFHAALSDIPAMGATPLSALCQLTLGPDVTARWLSRFAEKQRECAKVTGTPLIGGNITLGESTRVTTTVLGSVESGRILLRSGAQPKDEVWLIGQIGMAGAGLRLLQACPTRLRGQGSQRACLEAFRRPTALVSEGKKLGPLAHACMDVSDGLARDARQLAEASGVRVVLEAARVEAILSEPLKDLACSQDWDALELALQGGEDYALLATGPKENRPRFAQVIGRVEQIGRGRPVGAFLESGGKRESRTSLRALSGGFVHRSRK